MEVDLEMTGGVPARMKCSMAQDAVRASMFIATGDRGELTKFTGNLEAGAGVGVDVSVTTGTTGNPL